MKRCMRLRCVLQLHQSVDRGKREMHAVNWLERFLKICMERNMPCEEIASFTRHMRGKTDEEKEMLAKQFVEQLQAEQ